ncbi:hypothetical protein QTP70_025613 [Hemibagrus guttatus]|uniref:Ig-like domain-containing protein n=1 Tax=Hemibagrus guttatus TaxID=175788 RepID=A0AAE0R8Y4_9TELE|nr:hypothetical protein QTP70_025613 [Hemibagrus guttatus]
MALYNLLYIVRYIPLILTLLTACNFFNQYMVYKNYYTLIYFFIFFFTPGSFADKIGPKDEDANIARKETDTVTLKCSYETSSENIYLYWYKQYPNSSFYCIKMQGQDLIGRALLMIID